MSSAAVVIGALSVKLFVIFRNICARNYRSVTDLGFQPYKENSGKEPLPYSCYQTGSGFVRQKPITTPIDKEVGEIQ